MEKSNQVAMRREITVVKSLTNRSGKAMIETHPFGNFIPKNIKYLVLGSFTAASIHTDPEYDWYYNGKRSQFWPIIRQVYGLELSTTEAKQQLFTELRLGVADIIKQCERSQGNSSDTNLVNVVYNTDLRKVLTGNSVERLIFSSRFVEKLYKKVFKDLIIELPYIELVTLPSPSPRYAAMSKTQKVARYKELLPKIS